jgi:hypothetical protein
MAALLMVFAEFEREILGERVRARFAHFQGMSQFYDDTVAATGSGLCRMARHVTAHRALCNPPLRLDPPFWIGGIADRLR